MKIVHTKITIIVFIFAIITNSFSTIAKESWDDSAKKRKAEYIYLEALKQNEQDSIGRYYSLLNRAFELDSSDTNIGFEKGIMDMILYSKDSVKFFKAHSLAKRHFEANPEDYYSSIKFGLINDKIGLRNESLNVWGTLDSIFPNKTDITLRYANALAASLDSTDIFKAIEAYNRIEIAEGKDIGLTSHKIRALSAIKDTANIIKELTILLESSPNNSEYNVFAGQIYDYLGDDKKTIYHLNKACELDPSNGNAFFQRASYYKEIGDSIAFDQEVFNVLKHEDLNLEAKLQMLTGYIKALYADETQQPRIEELFAVLQEQHPHQYDIHELYCAYLAVIKDYNRAAEQMSYALDINPSNIDAWTQYISLCAQTNDKDLSYNAIERALHYFPSNPALLYQSGVILSIFNYTDKALSMFNNALPLISDNNKLKSDITCSIGDLFYKKELVDSAFTYYEKAIDLNPNNLLALNNYAYYLAEKGIDLDKAERLSARTISEDPDNDNSLDTYAWILFKKKNYTMARQYIDLALKHNESQSAELQHHAGDIYFMCGEPDKALEFWDAALKIDPQNELLKKKVKYKTYFYK